ncbi:MAG: 5-formyltetrahydrofolate cyclo-ligase [Schwartzia sp.]|nr:5-formyltetrahydrofolate cyclo-ligase [Schwartzia sp. (in: firmicutes)]
MNEGGDFAGQKRELRKRMLAARRALTEAERAAYSAKITEKLLSHSAVTQAQKIFAYAAMQDEVQTKPLLSRLLNMGKKVAVPWIIGKHVMEAALVPSMDALEVGAYGILTVQEERREILPPQELDCVIVPGVAFGMDGVRLGMGGGYYDTFLPKAERAVRIATAFQCQLTDDIPRLPHDCGVDWIITEQGVFKVSQK